MASGKRFWLASNAPRLVRAGACSRLAADGLAVAGGRGFELFEQAEGHAELEVSLGEVRVEGHGLASGGSCLFVAVRLDQYGAQPEEAASLLRLETHDALK